MTDKEQINEMAKIMCDDCRNSLPHQISPCGLKTCNGVQRQAELLYNAGYKQEKEVAKEIFARIFDTDVCGDLGEFCGVGWIFSVDEAKEIAEEFGIEVE